MLQDVFETVKKNLIGCGCVGGLLSGCTSGAGVLVLLLIGGPLLIGALAMCMGPADVMDAVKSAGDGASDLMGIPGDPNVPNSETAPYHAP